MVTDILPIYNIISYKCIYHIKYWSAYFTVIKAERLSNESASKGYAFPDEVDDISNYKGDSTQLLIPSSLLQDVISK